MIWGFIDIFRKTQKYSFSGFADAGKVWIYGFISLFFLVICNVMIYLLVKAFSQEILKFRYWQNA